MRKKDIVTICMLSLLSFVSCDMNLLDRLIGTISDKFSEEDYYAGLLRRRQDQSDVALKSGKKFKKSRNRREAIDLTGGGRDNNKNITEDVKDLQSVLSSQAQDSAVVLTPRGQQQQNESSDVVVPKLMGSVDILKTTESSDLESVEKFSDDNSQNNVAMVKQENEHNGPSKSVIEAQSVVPKSSAESDAESDAMLMQEEHQQKELADVDPQDAEFNSVKSAINSILGQIDTLSDNLKNKLLEFDRFKSEISDEKSKVKNIDINVRQVVEEIVADQKNIRTGNGLSVIEQIAEQASKNIIKNVDIAKVLYQNQVDVLSKMKVDVENLKDSDDILKVKNSLNNLENMIEEKINKDSGPQKARSKVRKEVGIFKEFIFRLASYKDKLSRSKHMQGGEEFAQKANFKNFLLRRHFDLFFGGQ